MMLSHEVSHEVAAQEDCEVAEDAREQADVAGMGPGAAIRAAGGAELGALAAQAVALQRCLDDLGEG